MITTEQYLEFVDSALDQMADVIGELGDGQVNERLAVAGSNSPYAIVTHCLGVMAYWAREANLGVDVHRDRPSEFTAQGSVTDLLEALAAGRAQLHADALAARPDDVPASGTDYPGGRWPTQGCVLVHVYEELVQHLGQLEVTRDVLLAG